LDTDRRTNLELNNTVINLNYDIRILKGDHETEKKNLEISSNSLERTKSENKDYIFSIEGLNRKLVEYQNNVVELKNDIKMLNMQLDSANKSLVELKTDFAASKSTNDSLSIQSESQKKEISV